MRAALLAWEPAPRRSRRNWHVTGAAAFRRRAAASIPAERPHPGCSISRFPEATAASCETRSCRPRRSLDRGQASVALLRLRPASKGRLRWSAVAVGGQERAYSAVRVPIEIGRCGRLVAPEQHRLIDRGRHDQPVELGGGEGGVLELQHAALGETLEGGGERGDRASGAALVERAAQLRKAARLADHQAAQLQQPGLHYPRELAACQVAEVRLDIAAVREVEHFLVDRIADLVDRADHDLDEQALLVGEVLVDGLL